MDHRDVVRIARLAARDIELKSLLLDVRHQGQVTVPKRKLMWLLGGRKNEHWTAWSALLDEWVEMGEARGMLYGTFEGPRIILIYGQPQQLSSTWANSGKDPVREAPATEGFQSGSEPDKAEPGSKGEGEPEPEA